MALEIILVATSHAVISFSSRKALCYVNQSVAWTQYSHARATYHNTQFNYGVRSTKCIPVCYHSYIIIIPTSTNVYINGTIVFHSLIFIVCFKNPSTLIVYQTIATLVVSIIDITYFISLRATVCSSRDLVNSLQPANATGYCQLMGTCIHN